MFSKRINTPYTVKVALSVSLFLLLLCLLFPRPLRAQPKQMTNISILEVLPFTLFGSSMKTCIDTTRAVVDIVNNRSDILSDYHIVLDVEEEVDPFAGYAPLEALLRYSEAPKTDAIKTPLMIGPFFSIGCQGIGRVLQHLSMVDISFMCTSPTLTNHIAYPNLYLTLSTGEILAMGIVRFIKLIGQWNRIALITNAGSINDYTTASFVQNFALASNISVPIYNIVLDIDDSTVEQLVANDIRITVVYSTDDAFAWKFLCKAFHMGITGGKFVFIMDGTIAADPLSVENLNNYTCNPGILAEQFKYSVWASQALYNPNSDWRAEFGYTLSQFDHLLGLTGNETDLGYNFHPVCHDTILQGIFALDMADSELRAKHNLTLKDYAQQENQALIAKVLNRSLLHLNRAGLREQMRYSKRGYNEGDIVLFSQWENRLVDFFKSELLSSGSSEPVPSSYIINETRPFSWFNWNAKNNPPRDCPHFVEKKAEVPDKFIIAICVISGISSLADIAATVATFAVRNRERFYYGKYFGYTGCLVLNAAAITFALYTTTVSPIITNIVGFALLEGGVSICHGSLSFRMILLSWEVSKQAKLCQRMSSTKPRQGNQATTRFVERLPTVGPVVASSVVGVNSGECNVEWLEAIISKINVHLVEKMAAMFSVIFATLQLCLVTVWLATDNYKCTLTSQLLEEAYYDAGSDTYIKTSSTVSCHSQHQSSWIIPLVIIHLALLGWAAYENYRIRHQPGGVASHLPEFGPIQLAVAGTSTLFAGFILLVLVVQSEVKQAMVISIGCLLISATAMATWVYPNLKYLLGVS